MTTTEKRHAYQNFFLKSEAGKEFISKLHEIIDSNHRKGEKDPALARDYSQRASGIREVQEHIQSLTAERRDKAEQ